MDNGREKGRLSDPFSLFVKAMNAVGCGLTMFLMVVIMIDVCGRSFFSHPITGVPELVTSLITIIAFLQLTYVQMVDQHLNVGIFVEKLPIKIRNYLKLFNSVLGIIVFSMMVKSSYSNLLYSIAQNEREGEGALVLPMWPVRGTIFFCSCIVLILMVRQAYWLLCGKSILGERIIGEKEGEKIALNS